MTNKYLMSSDNFYYRASVERKMRCDDFWTTAGQGYMSLHGSIYGSANILMIRWGLCLRYGMRGPEASWPVTYIFPDGAALVHVF